MSRIGKGHVLREPVRPAGKAETRKKWSRFVLSQDKDLVRDDSGSRAGRGAYACKRPPRASKRFIGPQALSRGSSDVLPGKGGRQDDGGTRVLSGLRI